MSTPHTTRHVEQLEAHIAASESTQLPAALRDCATCREQLADYERVAGLLDQTAELERQGLADAAATPFAAGEERARAFFESVAPVDSARAQHTATPIRSRPRSAGRKRALWVVVATAVAASVTLYLRRPSQDSYTPRPGLTLSARRIERVAPQASAATWERFEWRGRLANATHWRLEVFAATNAQSTPLHVEDNLHTTLWEPTSEVTRNWPRALRWTVAAIGSNGPVYEQEFESALLP